MISANFVPVTANLKKIRDPSDPNADFFRSVQRQKDQYQGIWVVTADGKALAREHAFDRQNLSAEEIDKRFIRATLDMRDEGLKAFGPVTRRHAKPEEQLPYRGVGVKADGSVDLGIYRRKLYQGNSDGPALRDTLTLSKEEWAALTPGKPAAGDKWVIPAAIARKMVRPLCLNTLGGDMPAPEDAKVANLTATVESVEDGRARIRLSGTLEAIKMIKGIDSNSSYRGAAAAQGVAVYDINHTTMSSLLLVLHGTDDGMWQANLLPVGGPIHGPFSRRSDALAAEIEWLRRNPPSRCDFADGARILAGRQKSRLSPPSQTLVVRLPASQYPHRHA